MADDKNNNGDGLPVDPHQELTERFFNQESPKPADSLDTVVMKATVDEKQPEITTEPKAIGPGYMLPGTPVPKPHDEEPNPEEIVQGGTNKKRSNIFKGIALTSMILAGAGFGYYIYASSPKIEIPEELKHPRYSTDQGRTYTGILLPKDAGTQDLPLVPLAVKAAPIDNEGAKQITEEYSNKKPKHANVTIEIPSKLEDICVQPTAEEMEKYILSNADEMMWRYLYAVPQGLYGKITFQAVSKEGKVEKIWVTSEIKNIPAYAKADLKKSYEQFFYNQGNFPTVKNPDNKRTCAKWIVNYKRRM